MGHFSEGLLARFASVHPGLWVGVIAVALSLSAVTGAQAAAAITTENLRVQEMPAAVGEECHTLIPALPQVFEALATFRGYSIRSAEMCFAWEGGQVTGNFNLAARWSDDDCTLTGDGQNTMIGTFAPKIVDDRIVGGALDGTVQSGVVNISIRGLCDDDKEKVTNESESLNSAGVAWEGNISNGVLFVTVPAAFDIPVLMTGVVMPPGGIEALGALGQGPIPAMISTLVGLIPPDAQGDIVDELLREMQRSGSTDLDDPAVLAKVAELVSNALLTGGARPDLPSPEALAAAAAAGLIPMAVFTALESALGAAGADGGSSSGATAAGDEKPVEIIVKDDPVYPSTPPEEVWLGGEPTGTDGLAGNPRATTRLIGDLNKYGIPATVVVGDDGSVYVQLPDDLPDDFKDVIYMSTTVTIVKDGVPQEIEVANSSVWVTTWPKDAPRLPALPADAIQTAPAPAPPPPDAADAPEAPDIPDEPESPAEAEERPVTPPIAEEEPKAPAEEPAPVTLPPPTPPVPVEAPGATALPSDLSQLDPEGVRQRLRDNADAINELKESFMAGMVIGPVLELMGIPPELNPLEGDPTRLTDAQLRAALAKVDQQKIADNLPALKKAWGMVGVGLDSATAEKGTKALDALERFFGGGAEEPGRTTAAIERAEGALAGAAPTGPGIAPVNAVDNVRSQYSGLIPADRLAQAYSTPMLEYGREEFDAGYRVFSRGQDPTHVNGFVMRGEGMEPHVALREGGIATGTAQHEALHLASNPEFKARTSQYFNEAVTEHLSREFTGPAGIDTSHIAYHKHGGTAMVEKLIEITSEDLVKRAYFGQGTGAIEELRQAVNSRLGPGQFELIQRMTGDAPDMYNTATQVLSGTLRIDPSDLPGAP